MPPMHADKTESFTAKHAKNAKENNSFTAEAAKDAEASIIRI
jgi:hypothetical protein